MSRLPQSQSARKFGARKIGELVAPALQPLLAKQGLTQASLVLDWRAIVGDRVADMCEPARLQWPPRGPKTPDGGAAGSATLWVRAASGRAMEIQYLAPVILERANAHLGWRCIVRVAVRPEPMRPKKPLGRIPAPEKPGARGQAAHIARKVADDGLREALTRLGAAVISAKE